MGAADAKAVFPTLTPADKRGEVVRFEEGFSVINDSYNSSPTALAALTELLAATPGYKRRILAAGEMLELGASAPELHRECGRTTAKLKKIEWIIGVMWKPTGNRVRGCGGRAPARADEIFRQAPLLAGMVAEKFVKPGDLLLLKGSRGVRMEKVLDAIDAQHKRAASSSRAEVVAGDRKGRG